MLLEWSRPSRAGRHQPRAGKQTHPAARRGVAALIALAICDGVNAHASVDRSGLVRLAQHAEPQIRMSPTIVVQAASQVAMPIVVGPPGGVPSNCFVRLRGLPPSVSLSQGHSVGAGTWAIPLYALAALKVNVPVGVSGRVPITAILVTVDGTVLAEASSTLIIAVKSATELSREAAARSAPPPAPAVAPPTESGPRAQELALTQRQQAERLLAQGERYLAEGKVAGARLLFRQAVDAGLALAALRLAATYDPAELSRLQVQGITPEPAEARKWYQRALELGAPEAEEHLARLGDRR